MATVTVRELRNRGGDVLNRVAAGETITVTRDGQAVAELMPLTRKPLSADVLLARWRRLKPVDADRLRADLDAVIDARL